MTANDVDLILALLSERGGALYGGEEVTQLEHALQAAACAEQAREPNALVAAALLHDIGHLLPTETGVDGARDPGGFRHEVAGARYLTRWFDADVTEPIRLHVPAKRYLVTTEPTYFATLSAESILSLEVQGGRMDAKERERFERDPYAEAAIRLRRIDEAAKEPSQRTPTLEHFRTAVHNATRPHS